MATATIEEFRIELDPYAEDWRWEDNYDELQSFFCNQEFDYFRINGRAMGWTRADGFVVVRGEQVIDALKLNGDYRLEFIFESSELAMPVRVVRYSHDEPTGAYFDIVEATEEDIENYA